MAAAAHLCSFIQQPNLIIPFVKATFFNITELDRFLFNG